MKKGLADNAPRMAVTLLLVMIVVGIGVDNILLKESRIRLETVDVAAVSLENSLYMSNAVNQASISVDLKPKDGKGTYLIEEKDGEVYLVYMMDAITGTQNNSHALDPPVRFSAEEGAANSVCIQRNKSQGKLKLVPGDC